MLDPAHPLTEAIDELDKPVQLALYHETLGANMRKLLQVSSLLIVPVSLGLAITCGIVAWELHTHFRAAAFILAIASAIQAAFAWNQYRHPERIIKNTLILACVIMLTMIAVLVVR